MLLTATALAIWNDVVAGGELAFDDWHVNEHMPERLAVPGFLRGRRYAADLPGHYFTLYEVSDPGVLSSAAYRARLDNPTEWSTRVVPLVSSRTRTALDIRTSLGDGVGGLLATIEFDAVAGRESELTAWIDGTALTSALSDPAVVAVHHGLADRARSKLDTVEESLMQARDEVARRVVMIEAVDAAGAVRVAHQIADGLEEHGAVDDHTTEIFRLTNLLEANR